LRSLSLSLSLSLSFFLFLSLQVSTLNAKRRNSMTPSAQRHPNRSGRQELGPSRVRTRQRRPRRSRPSLCSHCRRIGSSAVCTSETVQLPKNSGRAAQKLRYLQRKRTNEETAVSQAFPFLFFPFLFFPFLFFPHPFPYHTCVEGLVNQLPAATLTATPTATPTATLSLVRNHNLLLRTVVCSGLADRSFA
jgi:hypothetical protein